MADIHSVTVMYGGMAVDLVPDLLCVNPKES